MARAEVHSGICGYGYEMQVKVTSLDQTPCGSNVNLINVKPRELGLEAMRYGLCYETLRQFAPRLDIANFEIKEGLNV